MKAEYDLSTMKSRKNPYASKLKTPVSIRLSADVVQYFKAMAEESGVPYQSLINLYLRRIGVELGSDHHFFIQTCCMKRLVLTAALALLCAGPALAWSNHALASYRAFEGMPEAVQAEPVRAEPLEQFLAAQAGPLAKLLDAQDAWAKLNVPEYPPLSADLRFDPQVAQQGPQALRQAFLMALRVSPESRLALYVQPDPWGPPPTAPVLAHDVVSALPSGKEASERHVFVQLHAGEAVAPLAVLASASDEPDYGMDVNLWEDSPGPAGARYGFGTLPFGNPSLSFATQAPFHMRFDHEPGVIYAAAPFIKRTYPLLRLHQYTGLARLAFESGHAYWGWRFAGLAMHYVQDLTQPYHAAMAPGFSSARLIGIQLLAMLGMPGGKNDMVVLLSNRHLVLERYESELIRANARARHSGAIEQALRDTASDAAYGPWRELGMKDGVARESHGQAEPITEKLLATVPARFVDDARLDFGAGGAGVDLMAEIAHHGADARAALDASVAGLMRHFGAHSRRLMRAILQGEAS